jgi:hypothetical protein
MSRVVDTAVFLFRVTDKMRDILSLYGISYQPGQGVYKQLSEWDSSAFANGPDSVFTYEVTDIINSPGRYHLCLDYLDCACGTDIKNIEVFETDAASGIKKISLLPGYSVNTTVLKRLNRFEPWAELLFDVDSISDNLKRTLRVSVYGSSSPEISCRGIMGIRKMQ